MTFLLGGFGKTATKLIQEKFTTNGNAARITSDDGLFCAVALGDEQLDAIAIDNNNGLLLGTVFTKTTYEPIKKFNKNIEIADLMNNYWGRYSGTLYDLSTKKISLVRDPLGLETLYYMPLEDGIIFSNKLVNLVNLLEKKPEVDWHYFAEYLIERVFLFSETPFKGVSELLPGMHLQADLNGTVNQSFEWQIPTEKATDEKAIEDAIFNSFKNSTQAWASGSQKATLQLSGGVDSSSILCMLKHVAPNICIQGIHYDDSTAPSSREISYAQKVAHECEIPLKVIETGNSKNLLKPLPADWLPEKPKDAQGYNSAKELIELANKGMIVSGQGGDHVFLAAPPIESVADYLLDNGLRGISQIIHKFSSAYRTSWFTIIKQNIKALKNYYSGTLNPTQEDIQYSILNPEFLQNLPAKKFYLAEELKKFPPAKAMQIEILYHAISDLDPIEETVTYPLLSIPLVEEALKIPAYMSIKDGYDRYYLRKAASKVNPTNVIWRKNKGEVSASAIKVLQNELQPISALINQGLLLKHGILDKNWLENKLDRIRHGDTYDLISICRIISAELWLKQWGYN